MCLLSVIAMRRCQVPASHTTKYKKTHTAAVDGGSNQQQEISTVTDTAAPEQQEHQQRAQQSRAFPTCCFAVIMYCFAPMSSVKGRMCVRL